MIEVVELVIAGTAILLGSVVWWAASLAAEGYRQVRSLIRSVN